MVGAAIQGRFVGLRLGDELWLRKNRPVHIVGVFAEGGSAADSEVWVGLNTAQAAFGREGVVSSVRVRLKAGTFDSFHRAVAADRQLSVEVLRESDYYQKQSQATSMLIGTLGALISIFFSAGAVLAAMITMQASVANRRRELGTLRALGFSRLQVILAVLLEGLTLAVVGGVAGAVCSLGLSAVKLSLLNSTTWSEMIFSFEPTPGILIGSVLLAAIMGLFGALLPAVQAARVSPIDAMRA
jgi:putative ABC transport system permease protein